MASANTTSLRAGKRRHRRPRRAPARILIGLAAATLALAVLTAAVAGAGRLIAVSVAARAQLRPTLALMSPAEAAAKPVGRAAQWRIVASLALPEPRPTALPVLALAAPGPAVTVPPVATAEPADDVAVTGALGGGASLAHVIAAVAPHRDAPAPALSPRVLALPLPRARPRLAALMPADTPAGKLDDDSLSLRTAVYDITARAVYLPNGERLEAHSGLGPLMDDPRHIRLRMRGATPPNVYKLTLREKLFHGVQAIRMTPADAGAMFGRDGILAHSYMLGASGQSNGCVSFRDYPRFLRAFLNGEIDRMVVVARLAKPPAMYARRGVRTAGREMQGM